MSSGHDHPRRAAAGGPGDGEATWFKLMDALVWVAFAVIVVLGAEWLVGFVTREKLGRQAERFLAKAAAKPDAD